MDRAGELQPDAVDERLHNSLRVTFTYVFVSVPLQLAIALLLAVILDRGVRGMGFYRSVFYLPSLLGWSVAIAILWRQVFGTEGLLNQVLALVGVEGKGWISDPSTALDTLVVLHVWRSASPMVIFLAGLRQVPTMYYEAAAVDGAGALRRFFGITLPLLTPIIFFNLMMQIIDAFKAFTQAFVVSGGTGGPSDSTCSTRSTSITAASGSSTWATPRRWPGCCWWSSRSSPAVDFRSSKYWVFYRRIELTRQVAGRADRAGSHLAADRLRAGRCCTR